MLHEEDFIRFFKTRERLRAREKRMLSQLQYCKKNMSEREPALSEEQLLAVKKRWQDISFACNVDPAWAQMYTNKTGHFSPDYIPNELHYYFVENSLINYDYLRAFVDKNYFSFLFSDIKQPNTVVKKIAGLYYDGNNNHISTEEAIQQIQKKVCRGIVIKPSNNSWGGRNISIIEQDTISEEDVRALFEDYGWNFIVQEKIKQHPDLAAIHSESVNTVRIISIMLNGELTFLSACLRMGRGTSQVDNFSQGGVACGILPDGRLKDIGYDRFGNKVLQHPDGFQFNRCVVPNFEGVVNAVKKCAYRVPQFGIASWDFAVDDCGDPVFIEYNVAQGSIDIHQYNNGPIYGENTDRIIDYVFKNYCVEDTTLGYNYNVFRDHVTLKNGSKSRKYIYVSPKHHELPVTRIGQKAFEDSKICRIFLPKTLQHIDYCAFFNCKNLRYVKIPVGVKTIGRSAFNGCLSLTKIKLPCTVTSIETRAFKDIKNLRISIPCSVEKISDHAFEGCTNVVIICKKHSYAETYAQNHGIKFTYR